MPATQPWTVTRPLFAAILIFLSACSTGGDVSLPSCPKVTILEDTGTLTRFREGPGRDPIDVNFTGGIRRLTGSCLYDVNTDTNAGTLNMDVQVEVTMERGPANRDHKAGFDYFVSIVNADGKVIAKEIFPLNVEFYGNKTTSRETDAPVSMNIPVTAEQGSQDFKIFVGFQLSVDEIRYNRDQARNGRS